MANYRVDRVAQEILREVNDIIRNTVRDPRVDGVTITDVELTGDLQQATIYYSTLDTDEETKKSLEFFKEVEKEEPKPKKKATKKKTTKKKAE